MARQRRTGGFRTPELKGTLGTLLTTALQQASAVRDVITNNARSRLDDMRHNRRRHDALAELGEIVLDLVQRGEIDLDELPEARKIVDELLDDDGHEPAVEVATPPSRSRFDDRKAKSDGTVSSASSASSRWSLPKQGQPAPSRVWRPTIETTPPPIASAPVPAAKKGGISFDDDDLAEYMHPDDVPPKDER